MNPLFKKTIAVFMSGILVISLTPISIWADESNVDEQVASDQSVEYQFSTQGVNPVRVNEAISKFSDALSKFYADTSKMSAISSCLTRFGGLTSAASGVLSILQISGLVKDPVQQALGKILDAIGNMQTRLTQMDTKLNAIQSELTRIEAAQLEISRNAKADQMLTNWNDFNTNYCEPLEDKIATYQGYINEGIKQWWTTGGHDGIRVLYAKNKGGNALTYSNRDYSQGFPKTADNGEDVNLDASFGIEANMIPDTSSYKWDINNYRSWFINTLSNQIVTAANNRELDAKDSFYAAWDALSAKNKKKKATQYASDALDSYIYKISCDAMSNNDQFVISVLNAYRNYCKNVLSQNSGINAMLNAIYLTHGFEGEAKDDIVEFINGMVVQAGYYGQFALSCAGQDNMQSTANRQDLQSLFTETVESLYDRRDKALVGQDNYCYITGTTMQYTTIGVTSTACMHTKSTDYEGCSSENWVADPIPPMLDAAYFQVIASQFRTRPNDAVNLATYLSKYKTGIIPNNRLIMTKYTGQQTFGLDAGISMKAEAPFGDYFKNYSNYLINVGNSSDIEDKYFHIHDKVVYDVYDMSNGTLAPNATAGGRALYGESHWYWTTDEACNFWTDSMTTMRSSTAYSGKDKYTTYYYGLTLPLIKLDTPHDLNGGPFDKENPFFAFDAPSLTEITYKSVGPDVQEKTMPITDIELQSETYYFEGKPVKPEVVVKSHDKIVPADSYELTYIDNDAVGVAQVKAEGKGDYSGMIVKKFTVTDDESKASGRVDSGKGSGSAKTGSASSGSYSAPKTGDEFLLGLTGLFALSLILIGVYLRRRNYAR